MAKSIFYFTLLLSLFSYANEESRIVKCDYDYLHEAPGNIKEILHLSFKYDVLHQGGQFISINSTVKNNHNSHTAKSYAGLFNSNELNAVFTIPSDFDQFIISFHYSRSELINHTVVSAKIENIISAMTIKEPHKTTQYLSQLTLYTQNQDEVKLQGSCIVE